MREEYSDMGRARSTTRAIRRAGACAAVLLAPACTAFDEFAFPEPTAQVTLVGELQADRAPATPDSLYPQGAPRPTCPVGTTVYWGSARNTGDLPVEQVTAQIDVFDAAGTGLGRFRESIFSGEVGTDLVGNENPLPTLEVDQIGHFIVCTTVPWGDAARAEFSVDFVVVIEEE